MLAATASACAAWFLHSLPLGTTASSVTAPEAVELVTAF